MRRARELRLFRAEFLELGGYRIESSLNGSSVESVDSISYQGHPLALGMLNMRKVIQALQSWVNVESESGKIFSDQDLIEQLDSARKYPFVYLPGMFITLSTDPKALFRPCTEEDFITILSHHPELQKTNSEIQTFLEKGGMFKVEPSILWHAAAQSGGTIIKVKAIQTQCLEGPNDSCGRPLDMRERPFYIRQIIRGETGIPQLDNMYPLGCSNTSVEEGVFYFADKIAATSVWMERFLSFDDVWDGNEPTPPRVPLDAEIFTLVDGDATKKYTLPHEKFCGLQSPKVMKRLLMPGKLAENPNACIRGIVLRNMPSHDGILFYMPESKWRRWIRDWGFDQGATALKVICPFAKGMARCLPDDIFTQEFKLPTDSPDLDCVMLIEAISNPDRVTDRFLCTTEGCSKEGLYFPAVDKSTPVCPECGNDMHGPLLEIERICRNPGCTHWGRTFRRKTEICPYCACPTEEFEIGLLWGNDLGQHDSDKRTGNPHGKASHQIVIRGAADKSIIRTSLIRQLRALQVLADMVWQAPRTIWTEVATVEGSRELIETTIHEKILSLMNMKADADKDSTFRGAAALLKAGVFAGNPRVIGRVTELLAGLALEGKQKIGLPARKIAGKFVRFGSPYVVPGFGLEPGQIRIPKSLRPLTAVNKEGKRLVTLLRYPIRPGGTEMQTSEVVGWSYGNVLEVHPEPWARMEGDFDGDTGTVLPIWITGICHQTSCTNPTSTKVPQPDSINDVVQLAIQAYNSKVDIGKVDVRNSEIITEFECQKEPATLEEGLFLRELQQFQLFAMKHMAKSVGDPPTVRLKELLDSTNLPKNPVNAVLYFRPAKSPSVPKLMKDFAKKEGLIIPASKYQNFAWLEFLRKFALYVLTDWKKEHPTEAYKVDNHPYREVLKVFAQLDFSKLQRLPALDWQYSQAFMELHHRSMKELESSYPELVNFAKSLARSIVVHSKKFADMCNNYRQEREDAVAADSREGWSVVESWCKDLRRRVRAAIGLKAQTDEALIKLLSLAVWSAAGIQDVSASPSFVFHTAPNPVISAAVRIYSTLYETGLDPLTSAHVQAHLSRKS